MPADASNHLTASGSDCLTPLPSLCIMPRLFWARGSPGSADRRKRNLIIRHNYYKSTPILSIEKNQLELELIYIETLLPISMAEHLEMRTRNITDEKVRLIGQLFPNCITESIQGE